MSAPTTRPQHGFDVAVVGAGPAGLAAATAAADRGLTVAVVDAGAQTGGQYWRHPDESRPRGEESEGHHDWRRYTGLRTRFRTHVEAGRLTHVASAQVWFVERSPDPGGGPEHGDTAHGDPAHGGPEHGDTAHGDPARGDTSHTLHLTPTTAAAAPVPDSVTARALILCPGGYDRQLPVPGWDLPGVMAAGGVQALLKGHRTLAGRRAVVAGTGPFLLPVARQLAEAGARVLAVCEANAPANWARHPSAALDAPSKLAEAAEYAAALARHRIPYLARTAVSRIEADGSGTEVGRVELARLDARGRIKRRTRTLDVDLVALGWGFTPSLELVTAVGAGTRLDVDHSLVAVVDAHQRSTVPGVYVAGEATGVGGALLAVAEGELAGRTAARDAEARDTAARVRGRGPGRAPDRVSNAVPDRAAGLAPDRTTARLRARIRRLRRFAAAMHLAHPVPSHWHEWLTDRTVLCRCEEVSYGAVREAREQLHADDMRTVKLLTRPGMGWCQGRVCGFATACVAAAAEGRRIGAEDLRPAAKQPLGAPVSLEHLAGGLDA